MSQNRSKKSVIDRYQSCLVQIFEEYLTGKIVEVYIYGSRAAGTAHETSDIDIAVKGLDLPAASLSKIREAFHESHIPYKIDLVDWNKAGEALKENIDKEGILIWQN